MNTRKILDAFFLQRKCCNYSMVTIAHFLFCRVYVKICWQTVDTSSLLVTSRIYYCYNQDRHIPSGAKFYLQKPKCRHTVDMIFMHFLSRFHSSVQVPHEGCVPLHLFIDTKNFVVLVLYHKWRVMFTWCTHIYPLIQRLAVYASVTKWYYQDILPHDVLL